LNTSSFQPVSNLARGLSLAFDGPIELAFGCNLSIVRPFGSPGIRDGFSARLGNVTVRQMAV